jgi:hypothetical protein
MKPNLVHVLSGQRGQLIKSGLKQDEAQASARAQAKEDSWIKSGLKASLP